MKSSENTGKKGLTYCMEKDEKSMYNLAEQQLSGSMTTAYKSFKGLNKESGECFVALKRRFRLMIPGVFFLLILLALGILPVL